MHIQDRYTGADDWKIHSVEFSSLSASIHGAMRKIDQLIETGKVRLLSVSAFSLEALWLEAEDTDRLAIVNRPQGKVGLAVGRVYTGFAFLQALAGYLRQHPEARAAFLATSAGMQRSPLPSATITRPPPPRDG
jgi:hypothetical protein